jgi:hypothetical protein
MSQNTKYILIPELQIPRDHPQALGKKQLVAADVKWQYNYN